MEQNKQALVEKLQNVNDKLVDLFGDEYPNRFVESYSICVPQQSVVPTKVVHKTYINHCSCPWWYHSWYMPHRCVKVEKPKKKDDEEEQTGNPVVGTAILGTVALVGTYTFATDSYVKLLRARLVCDLNDVAEASQLSGDSVHVNAAITRCRTWMQMYRARTRPTFWSKLGLTVSGIIMGFGVFVGNSNVTLAAFWLGIASSCIMVWNYFDPFGLHSRNKEISEYNDTIRSLSHAINVSQETVPSAPPMPSPSDEEAVSVPPTDLTNWYTHH